MSFPLSQLRTWFLQERRDLPWRESPTPYEVWISETMLQQTRVAVVLRYYDLWMKQFPDLKSLAEAPIEKIIKVWEGLGYYSRARNLHETAKKILSSYEGNLPEDEKELEKLKGFGPYTIGALRSFAFHKKAAAVDGNVYRVLTRYFLIEEEITKKSTQKTIKDLVEGLLPDFEPWVIMEALIELGAKICTKKPRCQVCPLRENCVSLLRGKAEELPKKNTKQETIILFRQVAVIKWKNEVLIAKEPSGKIMADLYYFPYFERENQGYTSKRLVEDIFQNFSLKVRLQKKLEKVTHGFTKYSAHLFPSLLEAEEKLSIPGFEWVEWEKAKELPFSAGYRKIIINFQQV